MSITINNFEDILDSRDIIARIEELRAITFLDPEEMEELTTLEALAEEGEQSSEDWHHGATLIRESYFESYAQELAEELGLIPEQYTWPTSCIDWERAARELQMDYTSVDFAGVTYLVR